MSIFLSQAEIIELTGYLRFHCQCDWLEANRYAFDKRKNGSPIVLRRELMDHLLSAGDQGHSNDDMNTPDFSALAAL